MNPSLPDGADDLFSDFDSVEDLSEEEAGEHGVDEGGDETEDDKDDVWDFREGANADVKPLNAPDSLFDILLLEAFFEQVHNNRDFPGQYVDQEYKGKVQVEHGDDEDEGGVDVGGDQEHGSGEVEVGLGVVLDEEEQGLDHGQHPRDE